jgi:thymidylate kinase
MSGKLIVFEGVDGIGKTSLSKAVAARLAEWGVPHVSLAFPGNDPGTLGALVYTIHHDPGSVGLSSLSPLALQTLHVAAHFDAIERKIIPALESGSWVILDRFWWSTWVYGIEQGIDPPSLEALICAEKARWGAFSPDLLFMVDRPHAFRPEQDSDTFLRLRVGYQAMADREQQKYKVVAIENKEFAESADLISSQLRLLVSMSGDTQEESE